MSFENSVLSILLVYLLSYEGSEWEGCVPPQSQYLIPIILTLMYGHYILQGMILTYKIKHDQNLLEELEKGKKVALFALKTKTRISKDVKHIGLKSVIANQILKKYSFNKKLKKISSVKFTLPSQALQYNKGEIYTLCLKVGIDFDKSIEKIKQIELDETYAYISCEVKEESPFVHDSWMEVDLNSTGSRSGLLGERRGKDFKCSCGHVENADVNASFVISLRHQSIFQSPVDKDRDIGEERLARSTRIVG